MADLGITSFEEFDFISPPSKEGLIAAIETLDLLDALESDHSLSNTGRLMTEFPLPPRQSRIIAEAILKYPYVIKETIIAAAFLSTQSPYILPPGEETDARQAHHRFRDEDGDFVSYLKLYAAYMESSSKQKFCEKNYLDERAMAEIANVSNQLEEIVSHLKIPILSGGPREDYLCAVARGLIQFVCVRENRDFYRSLRADKILIHPGSVMFRLTPQYIIAGEIVRTTRMYAMSVSPLAYETLEKISPALVASLGVDRKGKEKDSGIRQRARDFTNHIKIGGEVFEIETVRGKKQVKLPWEKLKKIMDNTVADNAVIYKNLRGVVTLDGTYTLLEGEKLKLILSLAPALEIEGALDRKWFGKKSFNSYSNPEGNFGPDGLRRNVPDELLAVLPNLVKPGLIKRDGRSGKKELGFLCLFTDGEGNYWTKCSRRFHTSLNESLASVETLIDELAGHVDAGKKRLVNQCYRRLSDFLS
jgi:HrpA-like RNA helicase